jgi:hypothetical protein
VWNVNDAKRWYKGLAAGIGDAWALLIRNGIRHARGFSLNDTHYGSMSQELEVREVGGQVLNARIPDPNLTGYRRPRG